MSLRSLLRGSFGALLVLVLITTCSEAQPPGNLPKAPALIEAVPVHSFADLSRSSVMLSPDGKTLSTSQDGSMSVWDLTTGKLLRREEDVLFKHGLIPSPDGKLWLRHPFTKAELALYDPSSFKEVRRLEGASEMSCIRFSPDGKLVFAIQRATGKVKVWEVASGKLVTPTPFEKLADRMWTIHLSPNGAFIACCTESQFYMIDLQTGRSLWGLPWSMYQQGVAFSPDSRLVAVPRGSENRIDVHDAATGKLLTTIQWQVEGVYDPLLKRVVTTYDRREGVARVAFTADGRNLLAACIDRRVISIEVATWQLRYRFEARLGGGSLLPLPRGFQVATVANRPERPIDIWDLLNPTQTADHLDADQLRKILPALESTDAAKAWATMQKLVTNPKVTPSLLGESLKPVPAVDPKVVSDLIQQLDHDDSDIRDRAEESLSRLGGSVQDALRAADQRKPSKEVATRIGRLLDKINDHTTPERLRGARAIEVLEYLATEEAGQLLRHLEQGAAGAALTEVARTAVRRMKP